MDPCIDQFLELGYFGIPKTIMADNDPVFTSTKIQEYVERMGIRLVHSTPYYPQSNGQAEESNKVIKGILKKMIKERPRAWHDLLPKTIWAYLNSKVRLSVLLLMP